MMPYDASSFGALYGWTVAGGGEIVSERSVACITRDPCYLARFFRQVVWLDENGVLRIHTALHAPVDDPYSGGVIYKIYPNLIGRQNDTIVITTPPKQGPWHYVTAAAMPEYPWLTTNSLAPY